MRPFLLLWITVLVSQPTFGQPVGSNVYTYNPSATLKQAGYEELTLAEGTTRDFSHFIIQAITLAPNQPNQPVQQLDEEAILLVKSGELTLSLGKKSRTLAPGSVIMVMPGDDYRIDNRAARPLTYYQIRYTSNEMPDLDLYRLLGNSFWVDWREIAPTTNQQGSNRVFSPFPTIMSDRVALEMKTIGAGLAKQSTQTHRPAELLLILDHPVQIHLGETEKKAQPGDLIFIESEVAHGFYPGHREGWTYVSVRL